MYYKILIFLFLTLTYSCKESTKDTTIWIYKMVNDYSQKVPVELSADKTQIVSHSLKIGTQWPVSLSGGYFLNGSMGPNTGYLSLSIEEYNRFETLPDKDSLYKLLIDKDPFIEFYRLNDDRGIFMNGNGYLGFDTVLLNSIIRNGKLELYFDRLK